MKKNIILSIIFLLSIILFIIFNRVTQHNTPNTNPAITVTPTVEGFDKDKCKENIINNLNGQWKYIGEDYPNSPILTLNPDMTFQISNWFLKGQITIGKWKYNPDNTSIIFIIENIDSYWKEYLNRNLKIDYPAILSNSLNDKSLEIEVAYYESPSNFDRVCKVNKFFINLFNNNLYKSY